MNAQIKTERFEMRFDTEMLERIDEWRSCQSDLPSRAESIRRLIEKGLYSASNQNIELSAGDRLILHMLCELSDKVETNAEYKKFPHHDSSRIVGSALYDGHLWALKMEFSNLFHDGECNPKTVSEVIDILDMWSYMEMSYAHLTDQEKAKVAEEAAPFGNPVKFHGFDGNYEAEYYSITHCLVDDMDRFQFLKGRDINSHVPLVDRYRTMLKYYLPLRSSLVGRPMSADIVIHLMKIYKADERTMLDLQMGLTSFTLDQEG
jgi:uncharacterized protein